MGNKIDEVGNRYGKWLILEEAGKDKHGNILWKCICNCGNKSIVVGSSLRSGSSKSCGCVGVSRLPLGMSAFNQLYYRYKKDAKVRDFDFILTKEDFSFITQMNCHYCGARPSQVWGRRCNGNYTYTGIDRVDNSKGYTINNIVPCCGFCNHAKNNRTTKEFVNWLDRLVEYRRLHAAV